MIFGGIGIIFLAGFIYMKIRIDTYVYLSIITGIIVVANIVEYKLLTTFGVKRFKEL